MYFNNIIAPNNVKNFLYRIYNLNKIPYALLFLGHEGSGNLAIALSFAKQIIYNNNIINNNFDYINYNFIYPIYKIDSKKLNNNEFFNNKWYNFIQKEPYGNLKDWKKNIIFNYKNINNQLQIGVDQISELSKNIYYKKSYNKVIIIWMPEYLNKNASTKIVNLLDNIPEKTYFFFVAENQNMIYENLLSRIQLIKFDKLDNIYIEKNLKKFFNINDNIAKIIAIQSNGNWNKALKIQLNNKYIELDFSRYLIYWMRTCFLLKKNNKYIKYILFIMEDIYYWDKDDKIKFFIYCINIFRKILLNKYDIKIFINDYKNFNFKKFSKIVNIKNIDKILNIIDIAINDIEKRANFKILFLDITNKITKYIF